MDLLYNIVNSIPGKDTLLSSINLPINLVLKEKVKNDKVKVRAIFKYIIFIQTKINLKKYTNYVSKIEVGCKTKIQL